jgi:hypothetical protein
MEALYKSDALEKLLLCVIKSSYYLSKRARLLIEYILQQPPRNKGFWEDSLIPAIKEHNNVISQDELLGRIERHFANCQRS